MKTIFLWAICLVSAVFARGQVLQNPDFEYKDPTSNIGLKNWATRKPGNSFTIDSAHVHSGKYVLLIENPEGAPKSASIRQEVAVPRGPFRRLRYTGFIKVENVQGKAKLWINTYKDSIQSYGDAMADQVVTGTKAWMPYSIDVPLEDGVTRIVVGAALDGTGKAWFDGFSLEEVAVQKPMSKVAAAFLEEAFSKIEANALHRKTIDFSTLRRNVMQLAAGAQSTEDCYAAIRYALSQLNDHGHSRFLRPEERRQLEQPEVAVLTELPMPFGDVLAGKIAYIIVPAFQQVDAASTVAFADSLYGLIRKLDQVDPKGWIVDLRMNTGGNSFAMLAGISPLLTEGVVAYSLPAAGNAEAVVVGNGYAGTSDSIVLKISRPPYELKQKNSKIAVLTGPSTASAGEAVALSFRGQPGAKSFGEPTAGFSTANEPFFLSDGSMFVLTVSVGADRYKNPFGGVIRPEEVVEFSRGEFSFETDPVIQTALKWLE
jgi:carboxyl-terminal processing protease